MRWAFCLCNTLRLCSVNTVFKVEKVLAHSIWCSECQCVCAAITAGMALNTMYSFAPSWLQVTVSSSWPVRCLRRAWAGLLTPRSSGKPPAAASAMAASPLPVNPAQRLWAPAGRRAVRAPPWAAERAAPSPDLASAGAPRPLRVSCRCCQAAGTRRCSLFWSFQPFANENLLLLLLLLLPDFRQRVKI